ncbi:hypothetical protein [Neisseria meningitidis]|uniref:hypothetical protein n=1 Tax=Neisseria meningitidis TaxID=487 RepID=UPI00067DFB03|nr:hypothetical protein [Neisseria meningitidis]
MPSEPEEADSTDYSGLTKIRTKAAAAEQYKQYARQGTAVLGLNLIHYKRHLSSYLHHIETPPLLIPPLVRVIILFHGKRQV